MKSVILNALFKLYILVNDFSRSLFIKLLSYKFELFIIYFVFLS